jgi:hypothetical protein
MITLYIVGYIILGLVFIFVMGVFTGDMPDGSDIGMVSFATLAWPFFILMGVLWCVAQLPLFIARLGAKAKRHLEKDLSEGGK